MIKKGSITAETSASGNIRLSNLHDTIMIEAADLDDAIEALCALRFERNPVDHADFILKLIPDSAPFGESLTYRDVLTTFSGTVGADGRMSRSILDDIDDIDDIEGRKL